MAVTLSTPPWSARGTAPVNGPARDFAAVVCASSAGVHAALVRPHLHESAALGAAFAVAAVALAVASIAVAVLDPGPAAVAAVVLLVGTAAAYLVSRTTGIPGLTVHPEPFDFLGTAVSCLELAAAAVIGRPHIPRRSR